MTIWQTLGIEPTSDLSVIKQAYASQAKQYHPEEHPDEFRALHDAYRQASRYARQHPKQESPSLPKAVHSQPAFKPSFIPHQPTDNPRRAHLHDCTYDTFTKEQFCAYRTEQKRTSRAPSRSFEDPVLSRSHLHIRGASIAPDDPGGLNFDAVENEGGSEPAPTSAMETDATPSQAEAAEPPVSIPQKKQHPVLLTILSLLLWTAYLFSFAAVIPVPVTAALYVLLLIHLFRTGTVQRFLPLILLAGCMDFLTATVLSVLFEEILPQNMNFYLNAGLLFLTLLLFFVRLALRLHPCTHSS